MTPQNLAAHSLAAFERLVQHSAGYKPRAGQHAMAARVAETLARADLGEQEAARSAIAVIQAPTGVGKSAAYAATAISQALQRKTRVLISTATVALQEQLMTKDLPALAAALDTPFAYALAKGRGRYVCQLKLERLAGNAVDEDELFDNDELAPNSASASGQEERLAQRKRVFERMASALANGSWEGDRDTLVEPPEAQDWALLAAERHTCTVRHCPRFHTCSYYQARNRLTQAQVIVANHDLVLASLGTKTLPDLDNCLLVFDEGHHLPAVALEQFASSMDLSHLRWLEHLPKVLTEVSQALQLQLAHDVHTLAAQLRGALGTLGRLALDLLPSGTAVRGGAERTLRFAHGQLPEPLAEPVQQIQAQAQALMDALDALAAAVRQQAKETPDQALLCARHFARLGVLMPRLASVVSTAGLLLEHGAQPLAKWLHCDTDPPYLRLSAHASPIVPGDLLRQFLWHRVRAAVVTSASLTSCGSFDYFLAEAGLDANPDVQTLAVDSPFDYAAQGCLTVVQTAADPKDATTYTAEMVQALMADLAQIRHGALALFTSRSQMRAATEAVPGYLQDMVLVQGTRSRERLLAAHAERVHGGLPSVLFGLQSFGEGLDLPGTLCETVFIAKLPFAPPSEPVDEARAEWLRSIGRDPFNELVIPATGVKLLQWSGRAIRTEEDQAQVICYDKRLLQQAYGRRMLAGLPPYRLEQRRLPLSGDRVDAALR
ncbi:MAG: ATP-dependent DNA helicase DinG [Rhodoferax sp.]